VDIEQAVKCVETEYIRATAKFGKFNTPHEGYAVLLEEVDELWEEVKCNPRCPERMQKEAIQVAAMAIRFLVDCC